MARVVRGSISGRIESHTQREDEAIVCQACDRIIPSRVNLAAGEICPFCHCNVNLSLQDDVLEDDEISGDEEDVALPC